MEGWERSRGLGEKSRAGREVECWERSVGLGYKSRAGRKVEGLERSGGLGEKSRAGREGEGWERSFWLGGLRVGSMMSVGGVLLAPSITASMTDCDSPASGTARRAGAFRDTRHGSYTLLVCSGPQGATCTYLLLTSRIKSYL